MWISPCLLPACAIQDLVERLISARLLFLQSGLLAHSEKKHTALYVEDLEAKLAGIFLSKPKVDISWAGCCFLAFCTSQGYTWAVHPGLQLLPGQFPLGKKIQANAIVKKQTSVLALACLPVQDVGSTG